MIQRRKKCFDVGMCAGKPDVDGRRVTQDAKPERSSGREGEYVSLGQQNPRKITCEAARNEAAQCLIQLWESPIFHISPHKVFLRSRLVSISANR